MTLAKISLHCILKMAVLTQKLSSRPFNAANKLVLASKYFFPDNTKIASIVLLDKEKPDKHDILNYKLVNILNFFLRYTKR